MPEMLKTSWHSRGARAQIVDLRPRPARADATLLHSGRGLTEEGFVGLRLRRLDPRVQAIHESDMLLMPDPTTAVMDPFRRRPRPDPLFVADPITQEAITRSRHIAGRRRPTCGDRHRRRLLLGPRTQFYIFDGARFDQNQHEGYYISRSKAWASGQPGSRGYRPRYKRGTSRCPRISTGPAVDGAHSQQLGIPIEVQHHEVGTAGQAEMDMRYARCYHGGQRHELQVRRQERRLESR
jgi:glutamine synthetase